MKCVGLQLFSIAIVLGLFGVLSVDIVNGKRRIEM